ncbi:hypothetical protein [uncultured Paracoccus sp.]|jgi:tetratricopeptide (TPR) repeat protein|uniref:hypothetical protein n=1 Tax=uncultured Paracoccus sp. TaxID=189685 RepID=UPI002605E223|nr:hypothetical protein [uncultured Paracoccus sp.]
MAHTPPSNAAVDASTRPQGLAVIHGGDRRWKTLTETANQTYAQGEIPLARTAYLDALEEAEQLFAVALIQSCRFPAPVIYNVSCHNLAELAERVGDSREAEAFYRKAYDRLIEAARSPATPLSMRIACVQHLKQSLAALAQHLRSHECEEDVVDTAIRKAYDVAFDVFRVARHAEQADNDCPHCPIVSS